MENKNKLKNWAFVTVYTCVIVICVILDQLTKSFIFDQLLQKTTGNTVNVLGEFLCFKAVYNKGAAFGIAQGAGIIFFIITVLGIPLFLVMLWRSRTRSVCGQVGYAFIIGGTIGNAIDRGFIQTTAGEFFSGKVRDFISFSIFPPVFNIADSFLVIGVVLAVLALLAFDYDGLLPSLRQEKAQKAAGEQK